MRVRRCSGTSPGPSVDTDLTRALEAMSAPELRAFVRAALDENWGMIGGSRCQLLDGPCSQGPRWLEAESSVSPNCHRRHVVRGRDLSGTLRLLGATDQRSARQHRRAKLGEMFASQRGIGYLLLKAMESNEPTTITALALLLIV